MNLDQITPREREAWMHRANGLTPVEIGAAMGIAKGTVAGHMKSLLIKTKARSPGDLVRLAFIHGIVQIPSSEAERGNLRARVLQLETALYAFLASAPKRSAANGDIPDAGGWNQRKLKRAYALARAALTRQR